MSLLSNSTKAAESSDAQNAVPGSAQQADVPGSAQQPASLPLSEMNVRSAALGSWEVAVFGPKVRTYTYTWEGKPRTGATFGTMLVSVDDPMQYCCAEVKANPAKEAAVLNKAKEKFKEGLVFKLSKVSLASNVKKQYVNTPLQLVVNLRNTDSTSLLKVLKASAAQPAPPNSVADCIGILSNQQFDVTALIKHVSEIRSGGSYNGQPRSVIDVHLMDGSMMVGTQKMAELPVAVFADKPSSVEPTLFTELRKMATDKKPVSFFKLHGDRDPKTDTFSFTTSQDFLWIEAQSAKGEQLKADADSILGCTDVIAFAKPELHSLATNQDYKAQLAIETTCKLFASITQRTSVSSIEDGDTLWQINWVRVFEPEPGSKIRTNDGQRIFFQTTLLDFSEKLTIWIREKAALELSGCSDANSFEQAFQNNDLWFPQMASVKILRKSSAPSTPENATAHTNAAQPEKETNVEFLVVEAQEQDLLQAPSQKSLSLIPLLNARPNSADIVLPASVSMIQKSVHYSMIVFYNMCGEEVTKPCTKILALVRSSEKSALQQTGAGFKLTTNNVEDMLGSAAKPVAKFSLTAFCTLGSVPSFKLDPPRSTKSQAALILISDVLQASTAEKPASFMVDSVQLLSAEEAQRAVPVLKQFIHFTCLAHKGGQNARKRSSAYWTESESPANAAKCRLLGRSPTGEVLPEYSS